MCFLLKLFILFWCFVSRWGLEFLISPSPSNWKSTGAFQSFALWALGLCLLAEASVPLGTFQESPSVLMRIVLTSLYHWEAQGSVAMLSPWCPHRGSRTEPGNHTSTSEANQRARPNGRCSLGIQPRDTSEASCGHGPLTQCTGSNVQVSGAVGGHTSWAALPSGVRVFFPSSPETSEFRSNFVLRQRCSSLGAESLYHTFYLLSSPTFAEEHTAWSFAFSLAPLRTFTLYILSRIFFPTFSTQRLQILQSIPLFYKIKKRGPGDKIICPKSFSQKQSWDQKADLLIPPAPHSPQYSLVPILRWSQILQEVEMLGFLLLKMAALQHHPLRRWTPFCWTETPNALCKGLKMKTGNYWGFKLPEI